MLGLGLDCYESGLGLRGPCSRLSTAPLLLLLLLVLPPLAIPVGPVNDVGLFDRLAENVIHLMASTVPLFPEIRFRNLKMKNTIIVR